MGVVRPPAVAGSFYPRSGDELASVIDRMLAGSQPAELAVEPTAVIVPHAGYMYSGEVAAVAYRAIADCGPRRVIVLGPAHSVGFPGLVGPDADALQTPLGLVAVDPYRPPGVEDNHAAHANEHSLEVQVPFLQTLFETFTVLPLLTGEVTPAAAAEALGDSLDRAGTMAVISSDLSHYLDYDRATARDSATARAITDLAPEQLRAGDACGLVAVQAALEVGRDRDWTCQLLDLRNSGDTAGDRHRVVGYGSFVLGPPA